MIRAHDSGVMSVNGCEPDHPGAGDQDPDRAELAAHLGEGVLDRRPVGDVGRHRQRGHALGAQVLGDPLGADALTSSTATLWPRRPSS